MTSPAVRAVGVLMGLKVNDAVVAAAASSVRVSERDFNDKAGDLLVPAATKFVVTDLGNAFRGVWFFNFDVQPPLTMNLAGVDYTYDRMEAVVTSGALQGVTFHGQSNAGAPAYGIGRRDFLTKLICGE